MQRCPHHPYDFVPAAGCPSCAAERVVAESQAAEAERMRLKYEKKRAFRHEMRMSEQIFQGACDPEPFAASRMMKAMEEFPRDRVLGRYSVVSHEPYERDGKIYVRVKCVCGKSKELRTMYIRRTMKTQDVGWGCKSKKCLNAWRAGR